MRAMEQDFGREKEALKNQAAQREFALSRDLEGQKKIVEARDTEVQSLKGRINDINVQFVEANTKIDELTKETKLREARIKELEDRLAAAVRPAPEAVPHQDKKDAKDTKNAKDGRETAVQRDDRKDGKK
jgi:predicted  nucleic acid-binding Zn-ribbon protein